MEAFINISLQAALIILILTAGLVLYRLVVGPSIADRVTAFDVVTCITIGVVAIYAIVSENELFIDVIFVLSFVAFLGAIGFSYYLKRRNENDK